MLFVLDCFASTGLRTLRVQWQRPTIASPMADRAYGRENLREHHRGDLQQTPREAMTTPEASSPEAASPEQADTSHEASGTATPPVAVSSPSRRVESSMKEFDPQTLSPGWVICDGGRGRQFFWDAETQAGWGLC